MLLNFIFVLLGLLCTQVNSTANKVKLIQDYLKTEKTSTTFVIAFLCWDKKLKYDMWKNLFENNLRILILDLNEDNIQEYNYAQNIRYVIDLDCKNSKQFISKVNNKKLFSSPNKWLLLSTKEEIFENVNQYFSTFNILLDSNVIFAFSTKENVYKILEIYKINENSSIINKNFMRWTPTEGITYVKSKNLSNIRNDLEKTAYRACFVVTNNDTFNHFDDYRSSHIDTPTKLSYLFINHLIDYLNATKNYSFVSTWGYVAKDGLTYNGMVGALQRNEADIGNVLFMTVARIPIIDYIPMGISTRGKFVFRPPPLSYVANIFTLPFSLGVWISYVGLVFLASFLLYIAVKYEWKQPDLEVTDMALRDSFMEALMFTISGVAQQGYATEPRSGTGKLIMTFTFLALMFFYVSYAANIVVLLQSSSTNIQTLEDLLKSKLKLGVDDVIYSRYFFQITTEPIRKAIYQQKIAPPGQNPNFVPMEEGVSRMRKGFYAFHMEVGTGYKFIGDTFLESEKCGLREIEFLEVVDPFISVKKNSSYKEIVKVGFRKISESGLQSRELRKIYTKKPECNVMGGKFVSVGLIDVYPAFMVLIIGVGFAFFLYIFETIVSKKCAFCIN